MSLCSGVTWAPGSMSPSALVELPTERRCEVAVPGTWDVVVGHQRNACSRSDHVPAFDSKVPQPDGVRPGPATI